MIQKNSQAWMITFIAIGILISACAQLEAPKELSKKINTRAGELTLKFENVQATLKGTLQRATPCVDWNVKVISTKDIPISEVNINIFDKNKGVICIQMIGEPQEINEVIKNVDENTKYIVSFEDETVFEGKLR